MSGGDEVVTITLDENMNNIKRMEKLFDKLSDDDKTKVMVYASALRDKEVADEAGRAKV
jgi:hypothetical protein